MAPIMVKSSPKESATGRKRIQSNEVEAHPASETGKVAQRKETAAPKLTQDAVTFEELEASRRSAEDDEALRKDLYGRMHEIVDKILEIKRSSSSKKSANKIKELNQLQTDILMDVLSLRKLNRLDKLRIRKCRESTQEAKQRVDTFYLQLQNLLYEIKHLNREVSKCWQFWSADQDIELEPLSVLLESGPEHLVKQVQNDSDTHLTKLARLEFEKLQRQNLACQIQAKNAEKDDLFKSIEAKKSQLAKLKPQLRAILQSTKEVQKYLDLPIDQDHEQLERSKYLPLPLFVLYSETSAYAAACDSALNSCINGDLNEAQLELLNRKLAQRQMRQDVDDVFEETNNDDEDDVVREDKRDRVAKRESLTSCLKPTAEETLEVKMAKALAVHPLQVDVTVRLEQSLHGHAGSVSLSFRFLTFLEMVVVKMSLDYDKTQWDVSADGELLQSQDLLADLLHHDENDDDSDGKKTEGDWEQDSGRVLLNPLAKYRLQQLGLDSVSWEAVHQLGIPYRWAQCLAGLQFPRLAGQMGQADCDEQHRYEAEAARLNVNDQLCLSKLSFIVDEIRERFVARLSLQRQITLLEKTQLAVPDDLKALFPASTISTLRACVPMDWEQYVASSLTAHLVQGAFVNCRDHFFRLQINHDPAASLVALIAIKPTYPRHLPLFCISLQWQGEFNASNSELVRMLESDVNTRFLSGSSSGQVWKKGHYYDILSLQIRHLLACLDVMLESRIVDQQRQRAQAPAMADVIRHKFFLHPVRGRRRAPPLNYLPDLQLFKQ